MMSLIILNKFKSSNGLKDIMILWSLLAYALL
jgi:hypothetical protein